MVANCHAPMQSSHSDSTPVILDCFQAFGSLVEHPPAPGPAPLHYITLWTVLLHSLYVYIPLYIIASSPVCATTRLPAVSHPSTHILICSILGEHDRMFKSVIHLPPGLSALAVISPLASTSPSRPDTCQQTPYPKAGFTVPAKNLFH